VLEDVLVVVVVGARKGYGDRRAREHEDGRDRQPLGEEGHGKGFQRSGKRTPRPYPARIRL
jgi:hypothetical protein